MEEIIERANSLFVVDEYVHNVNSEGDTYRKAVITCDWWKELGKKREGEATRYYYIIKKEEKIYLLEVEEYSAWRPNITDWLEYRRISKFVSLPEREIHEIIEWEED